MKEYVISGHSGDTNETFVIPMNVTLMFFADPSTSCYVPNTEDSLPFVILSMRDANTNIHTQGDVVNNYEISFTLPFEGLAEIHREVRERVKMKDGNIEYGPNGEKVYEDYYHDSLSYMMTAHNSQGSITLEDFCNYLSRINNRGKITIFCVFCRGSKREFEGINFGVENMDKEPTMENMDDEDFSFLLDDLSGGKRCSGNRKYKYQRNKKFINNNKTSKNSRKTKKRSVKKYNTMKRKRLKRSLRRR